ncbi:MAG: 16S rRNA (guanine(966)-N(2))-methyltransferase RsmD [Deltaproteobacteria bacterium]|nr:16S rRNA (guanine(966)-N(2))-methyltransferase RsmD [Deltaproteobacteria bacterium]
MLRIVAGTLGGRRIAAPPGRETRPTSERVREALFSSLGHLVDWEGLQVVDLFAGSGALGIEALSRGAARAVFVESNARAAALIRANLKSLELAPPRARVVATRAESWLDRTEKTAADGPQTTLLGLVLLDPPYAYADTAGVLRRIVSAPQVAPGAIVVLEAAGGPPGKGRDLPEIPAGLVSIASKRYGDTRIEYLSKTPV